MSGSEPSEDFETHSRPPERPQESRPDWLVGADEGAHAETQREGLPATPLKLVRPIDAAPLDPGAPATPTGAGPVPGARPQKPAKPEAWKAAASSIPRLTHVQPEDDDQSIVTHRREEEMWPASERSRSEAPPLEFADEPADVEDLSADPLDPAPAPVRARPAAVITPIRALDEPWWAVAIDALQTSRAIQLGILAVVLAVVAWMMWPRGEKTVAISTIRQHPERFSGATVRVQGKVGDVYEVGGAWAYYLEQGGDTIVVFSRVRTPQRNDKVHVSGSVSMGYLDGIARPALFEIAP